MKKAISLLIILSMVLALCACGGSKTESTATSAAPAAEAKSEAAPAAEAKSEAAPAEEAKSEAAPAEEAAAPADDTVYTFSYASADGEESLRHIYLEQQFMDYVTEKSGGRIQFVFYPNGSLANTGSILQGMIDGTVDVGMDVGAWYAGVYPYNELLGTPGVNLGSTMEEKQKNLNIFNDAYLVDEFAKSAHIVADFPSLENYIVTMKEITSPADFEQENIMTSANFFDVFAAMGALTTPNNYAESYESLRLGVIDMIQAGYGVLNNFRLYEVCKYAYRFPLAVTNSTLFMRWDAYNSLPDDLKAIVDEGGKMLENQFNADFDNANQEIVGPKIEETNPDFVFAELPDSVVEHMAASCDEILAAKVAELNAAGLDGDGALELIKSFDVG